ncbi:Pyrimidine-specific ribonucleoside hydrolase RihA [Limihaloglobus sulfuriphilus]|uniref:Pyrimidine-specific ribonucleoside hydrolase RihA n=1 Tax=Limihaloglobus sulfuriphilus TaxID=1851148 RepID=A0A1Q2MHM6_9BACT|nr:nucleoside hydrolase [Limihaloglobus sulfuriphilus]AQQ72190.1 Pyrimidine-specific ribonucleoside hydrolase RihA [Limihaloglobus sulfuriphilus]
MKYLINHKFGIFVIFSLIIFGGLVCADSIEDGGHVVVDTDMGLDDAAALALILQSPHIKIEAVIAAEGVTNAADCARLCGRMLDMFNRPDVKLYETESNKNAPAPGFRPIAKNAIDSALPGSRREVSVSLFTPQSYTEHDEETVILALGPLTNLAAAIKADPDIIDRIEHIIIPGSPRSEENWNISRDKDAFEYVRASGAEIIFISPDPNAAKKGNIFTEAPFEPGANTSIAEQFMRKLLKDKSTLEHYAALPFFDEAAYIYLVEPEMFELTETDGVMTTSPRADLNEGFKYYLCLGRQHKHNVVFRDTMLPSFVFQPDIASRITDMVEKNGQTEFFSQMIMNELHDHLGAYSVIGVKMGLRAMELLNSPPHSMKVTTHAPDTQPASCIKDGIIVATGCTPGRALFFQGQVDEKRIKTSFEYNGREVTLVLKSEYTDKIRRTIQDILKTYTLEDHEYWENVREFGLDIWENWHRLDLFEMLENK